MVFAVKDEVWVLCDDRPGTASQAVGLAEKLGFEYRVINLEYSFFARLPNCILGSSFLALTAAKKREIKTINYLPRIVISSGRRAVSVALFIKKTSQQKTKVIQIMNPEISFKKFDLVILPEHDRKGRKDQENVVYTIGSLTKIDEKIIAKEAEKFAHLFTEIDKTKIAVFVGGSSAKSQFSSDSAEKLAKTCSKIANKMNAKLLVLTSRRTGDDLTKKILANLDCDFTLFDWKFCHQENPYLAILHYADFFVVTADSVSMISEACSTQKPVYIFDDGSISTAKHRLFCEKLFESNYAKKMPKTITSLKISYQKNLTKLGGLPLRCGINSLSTKFEKR